MASQRMCGYYSQLKLPCSVSLMQGRDGGIACHWVPIDTQWSGNQSSARFCLVEHGIMPLGGGVEMPSTCFLQAGNREVASSLVQPISPMGNWSTISASVGQKLGHGMKA